MSTEYMIIAEKDDDLIVFHDLYKMKRTLLAASNWTIDKIIDYAQNEIDQGWINEEHLEADFELLLKLINFIYTHPGYTFTLLDDNKFIDYMCDKYGEDWSFTTLKCYNGNPWKEHEEAHLSNRS